MSKQALIEKLKALGFKEYEAKTFLVLLKGKPMSASQIAKEARIIRNSIYDILKSFVEKGYCNEIETDTILNYQIIDPQIILDKIEKNYFDSYKSNVVTLKTTFDELQELYKSGTEEEYHPDINIQLVRGFNRHRVAKYTELFKNSHKEVFGMYRLNWVVSEELDSIAEKFIKSGGKIKSIYMSDLDFKIVKNGKVVPATNDDFTRVCEAFEKQGEEVRISESKIPNITVFDGSNVFINMGGKEVPKNKHADIIIKNPDLAQHMADLFHFYWDRSMSVQEYKNKYK
jgi:sugar-specific transcriptional regulator TrmB